jgi:hypothetical protein
MREHLDLGLRIPSAPPSSWGGRKRIGCAERFLRGRDLASVVP